MESSKRKFDYELCMFYLATFVGGFFAGYAMLRSGMFASSQTMNILSMVFNIFGHNFKEFLIRFLIMILYAGSISLSVLIPRYTKFDIRVVSACVTMITAVIMASIPVEATGVLTLLPIFCAMALQWNSFHGALGYQASCIFVTNNFRQAVLGGVNYLCTKDKKFLTQFLFYIGNVCIFFIGVIACYVCISLTGLRAVAIIILVPLFIISLIVTEKKQNVYVDKSGKVLYNEQ